MHLFACFFDFFGPWKNGLRWPQIGPGGFFPTNPDLADISGRKDLDFENLDFYFLDPTFLDFQVPRSPNSQISRFPDFQTPPPPTPDEFSDPNLTPLPTYPGIKYVARALAAMTFPAFLLELWSHKFVFAVIRLLIMWRCYVK